MLALLFAYLFIVGSGPQTWPKGAARLVALGNATTSDLTNLAAARDWAPPRTIDAREAGAHYYQWLKHMRPNTQRLVVARYGPC